MAASPTILGREPAFFVGLVEAVIAVALSFHALGLSGEQASLIVAFVTAGLGLWTAWVTDSTLLGVGTGLAKATVALFVGFGLHVTDSQQAAIVGLAVFALGAWQRTQVSPVPRGERTLSPAA